MSIFGTGLIVRIRPGSGGQVSLLQYPRTTYVRDYKKALVEKWGLSDDTSDVLAFDREGRLIFRKDGKLGAGDIEKLLKVVRDHL